MKLFENIQTADLKNETDKELYALIFLYRRVLYGWVEEVNNNGRSFDVDSQDIYKGFFENFVANFNLRERITVDIKPSEIRLFLLEELKRYIEVIITTYRQYKEIFDTLPRRPLMIGQYRKLYNPSSQSSDLEIYLEIGKIMASQDSFEYYCSEFYKQIGFIDENYHKLIYEYNLQLQSHLRNNLIDYEAIPNFQRKVYMDPFLTLSTCAIMYEFTNGQLFDHIQQHIFYKDVNLFSTIPQLNIKSGRKIHVSYFIHRVEPFVRNGLNVEWRDGVCSSIGIEPNFYKSKYKKVESADASSEDIKFRKLMDEMVNQLERPV